MTSRLSLVTSLWVLITIQSPQSPTPRPALPSDGIVVVKGATDLRRWDGADAKVEYVVRDPYPGSATIGDIRLVLNRRRWRVRTTDFLNGSALSTTERWGRYDDEGDCTMLRHEQWENKSGDIVWYQFTYSCARSRTLVAEGPLRVSVYFITADSVRQMSADLPKRK